MALKRHQKALLLAVGAALLMWFATPLRLLLLPLVYYNTHVHELSHALAGLLTGGSVESIQVFADCSGVTMTRGGSLLLLSTAGYVGSSIVGGIIIYGSRRPDSARRMLLLAAGFLAFSMLFFVRGDAVGVTTGFVWIIGLALCARLLKGDALVFSAQFLGVQQCLTSFQAFFALFIVAANDLGHSDAANLEQATHVPAVFWAVLWSLVSLAAIVIGVRRSWSDQPQ